MRRPLVLVHGFMDTPRTWELVRPRLEERFEVVAPALPGHLGGGPYRDAVDALVSCLDAEGLDAPAVAGNSLGGYLALRLAELGRASAVVALAPAGGWAPGDAAPRETLAWQQRIHRALQRMDIDGAVSTDRGRRQAMKYLTERHEHIPAELIAWQLHGAAATDVDAYVARALADGWPLDPARVACPVRIVWGRDDRILEWPRAAERYRAWFPQADWVELDGVGHCPQLDVPLEAAELIAGFAA